jgi:hypothetical protein
MTARSPFEVDDQFLRQVYRLALILAIVITGAFCVYSLPSGLSFAIGSCVSLSMLWSLEFVIRCIVKPGKSEKTKRWLGFIALGKYTILFAGFYFLIKADWLNVYALAGGIGLVQIVIILKAIGMMASILLYRNSASDEK